MNRIILLLAILALLTGLLGALSKMFLHQYHGAGNGFLIASCFFSLLLLGTWIRKQRISG